MQCPKCQHENEEANFCQQCGSSLTTKESESNSGNTEPSQPQSPPEQVQDSQPNKWLESAKRISKEYLNFFLKVLKNPYTQASKSGQEQLTNSFITIVLYALFLSFTICFGLSELKEFIDNPFLSVFLKPTLGYIVLVLLGAVFSFAAIKLGKVNADFRDVVSRFGVFLVPFVALFALTLIMSILQIWISTFILFFVFNVSIVVVPPLVIISFKKDNSAGLDTVYGTLIVYVLTAVTIVIMAELLFSIFIDIATNMFYSFFPY